VRTPCRFARTSRTCRYKPSFAGFRGGPTLTKTHGQTRNNRKGAAFPVRVVRLVEGRLGTRQAPEFAGASGLSDLSGPKTAGRAAITAARRKTELVNANGGERNGTEIPKNERFERY
jgi:hypothetical protein